MNDALMYDSDDETYPPGAYYIAAYVDGSRTGGNYERAKAKLPNAKFLLISAVGDADADVIDIEPGNVWPPENAIPWIRRQIARGAVPIFYCNTSTRDQCDAVFAAAGLPALPWWRADYRPADQRPASFALGEIAHQYADPPMNGAHWDVSVISDDLKARLDGDNLAALGTGRPIESEDDMAISEELQDRIRDTYNFAVWLWDWKQNIDPVIRNAYNAAVRASMQTDVILDVLAKMPTPSGMSDEQFASFLADSRESMAKALEGATLTVKTGEVPAQ